MNLIKGKEPPTRMNESSIYCVDTERGSFRAGQCHTYHKGRAVWSIKRRCNSQPDSLSSYVLWMLNLVLSAAVYSVGKLLYGECVINEPVNSGGMSEMTTGIESSSFLANFWAQ